MDHYTLQNFAMENFGRQISSIYFKLMKLSQCIPLWKFNYQHLEPVCTYLDHLIQKNVVSTLANAITEVAVKMILVSLKRWLVSHQRECSYQNNTYFYKCKHIAIKLSCAVTHSSTTKLNYARLCDEYNAFTHDFLREYLGQVLEKITNLRELVSLNHPGMIVMSDLKNLQHWSGYITPQNLCNLANSNGNLQILRLNNSDICDRSVSSILKFLKLIHLDVINTKLSAHGREKLIRGLKVSDRGGHNRVQRSHLLFLALKASSRVLNMLPEYLPNLQTLNLYLEKSMNLTVLKGLKQLTSLSLKCSSSVDFDCAVSLIEQIGWHLNALNLDMNNVDLKFVSKYCPELKEFGLHVRLLDPEGNVHPLENYLQNIPKEFNSVERLDLIMYGYAIWNVLPHFLSCFKNVKILKVNCDSESQYSNPYINECLLNPLHEGRLKEISINGYRLHQNGSQVVIYDIHGFSVIVMTNDLDDVIMTLIYRKGILNLRRKVRFVLN